MILQDDRHARTQFSQRQHLAREVEAMHVKNIWCEAVKQRAVGITVHIPRPNIFKWQKVILHAVAVKLLNMRGSLDDGDANARR